MADNEPLVMEESYLPVNLCPDLSIDFMKSQNMNILYLEDLNLINVTYNRRSFIYSNSSPFTFMIKLKQHDLGFRLQGEYRMTQKIIFFDIDGTLLNDDKELPDSAEEAVQQLKDDGHIVVLATGRAPFNFKKLRKRLDIRSEERRVGKER